MKNIVRYAPSVCGFNVVFFSDIKITSPVEKAKEAIEDINKHKEEQFFESYSEAQDCLIKTLQKDNDYYLGVIIMVWYDYKDGADGKSGVGDCRAYTCVAEAWAEDGEN